MAGFSFADEKEAAHFYKRVEHKDKYAKSKVTKAPTTIAAARSVSGNHGVGRENAPVSRSVSTSRIHAII